MCWLVCVCCSVVGGNFLSIWVKLTRPIRGKISNLTQSGLKVNKCNQCVDCGVTVVNVCASAIACRVDSHVELPYDCAI